METHVETNPEEGRVRTRAESRLAKVDYSKYYAFKQTERESVKVSLNKMMNAFENIRKLLQLAVGKNFPQATNTNVQSLISEVEMTVLERMTEFVELDNTLLFISKDNELLRDKVKELEDKKEVAIIKVKGKEKDGKFRRKIDDGKDMYSLYIENIGDKEEDIKNIIREEMRTTKTKISINDVIVTRDKKVILKAEDKNKLEEFGKWFQGREVLKEKFKVSEPRKKMERIMLLGVSQDTEDQRVEEDLKEYTTNEDSYVKIYKSIKRKDGLVNWIVDVDSKTKEELLVIQQICVEFMRVRVVEYIFIIRCFRCQGFGHTVGRCRHREQCAICAEEHDTRLCKSTSIKCVNCTEDSNHRADSYQCPSFVKYKKEKIAKRL